MPAAFDAKAAGDLSAVIQFDVTDEDPGDYFLRIERGTCSAYAGVHPEPQLTIHTPTDIWMKIGSGELSGSTAFMTRKCTITGDMSLLMSLGKLFAGTQWAARRSRIQLLSSIVYRARRRWIPRRAIREAPASKRTPQPGTDTGRPRIVSR